MGHKGCSCQAPSVPALQGGALALAVFGQDPEPTPLILPDVLPKSPQFVGCVLDSGCLCTWGCYSGRARPSCQKHVPCHLVWVVVIGGWLRLWAVLDLRRLWREAFTCSFICSLLFPQWSCLHPPSRRSGTPVSVYNTWHSYTILTCLTCTGTHRSSFSVFSFIQKHKFVT